MGLRLCLFWSVSVRFIVPIKLFFFFFFVIKRNICFNPFSLQSFPFGCLEAPKKTRKRNKGGALSHIHRFHQHPSLTPPSSLILRKEENKSFQIFFHSRKKITGGRDGFPHIPCEGQNREMQKKTAGKLGSGGPQKTKRPQSPTDSY